MIFDESEIPKTQSSNSDFFDGKDCLNGSSNLTISKNTFNQIIYIIDTIGKFAFEKKMHQNAIEILIDCLKEDLIDSDSQQVLQELIEKKKSWKELGKQIVVFAGICAALASLPHILKKTGLSNHA